MFFDNDDEDRAIKKKEKDEEKELRKNLGLEDQTGIDSDDEKEDDSDI